jgi:DNA mismatch repair protein MutH
MGEKQKLDYNSSDKDSIYSYAKMLVNKTLRTETSSPEEFENVHKKEVKGKFGQYLEKYYFGLENNSRSEPDFKETGIELKSTSLKKLSNNKLSPKERLVLNIINFNEITKETWENSHFLEKNKLILFVMYLFDKDKSFLDYLIKYVHLWELKDTDKEIIRQDWEKIVNKIKENKAHELSEGDTLYLGACRKGHKEKPKRYSNSTIPAKQRAFSFKTKFMRSIISEIQDSESLKIPSKKLRDNSFEDIVIHKFEKFYGLEIKGIEKKLGIKLNKSAKGYYASLARKMLKVDSKNIEEFEKSEIEMKIIRLKHNGVPKEDMSFPYFKYLEIENQEWIDSDFFKKTETKFLFVVYQMNKNETSVKLQKVFFWNMPFKDREEAKKIWIKTKKLIKNNVYDSFPKKSDGDVAHVRSHARNKDDTTEAPNGNFYTKRSFWLNAKYLKKQIEE